MTKVPQGNGEGWFARRRADRRRGVAASILVGILGVAACDGWSTPLSIPTTLRTPEIVGIVEDLDPEARPPVVRLVGGDTFDPAGATPIAHVGTLEAGSLLLAGTQPTPWYAYIREFTPGCYALFSRGRDEGATVVTEDGLRLTKAPGFAAPDDPDGLYTRPGDQFCLGPDGLVTGYGLIR